MSKYTWLLDNGHGGLVKGKYTTAPSKMHKHSNGLLVEEGLINRAVISILVAKLNRERIDYKLICPENEDIDLDDRVDRANSTPGKCIFVSQHCNAGGGEGFEVWTSRGLTKSDGFATIFFEEVKKTFPDWKMRKDTTDGDVDKEKDLYVLKHTNCPALLLEFGFMDTLSDAELIMSEEGQEAYAEALFRAIKRIEG